MLISLNLNIICHIFEVAYQATMLIKQSYKCPCNNAKMQYLVNVFIHQQNSNTSTTFLSLSRVAIICLNHLKGDHF